MVQERAGVEQHKKIPVTEAQWFRHSGKKGGGRGPAEMLPIHEHQPRLVSPLSCGRADTRRVFPA